jgi:hypothetical protein
MSFEKIITPKNNQNASGSSKPLSIAQTMPNPIPVKWDSDAIHQKIKNQYAKQPPSGKGKDDKQKHFIQPTYLLSAFIEN